MKPIISIGVILSLVYITWQQIPLHHNNETATPNKDSDGLENYGLSDKFDWLKPADLIQFLINLYYTKEQYRIIAQCIAFAIAGKVLFVAYFAYLKREAAKKSEKASADRKRRMQKGYQKLQQKDAQLNIMKGKRV